MVPPPTGRRTWPALVVFALLVCVAALIGGLAAAGARDTYAALELPTWAPPGWVFGPVWTVLYALIALAAWLVWRSVGVDAATWAWGVQLVLNVAWTPLFFGADRYGLALAEIVVLWVAIVVTIVLFWQRHRLAGALMLPYLAWTSFAGVLNLAVWRLN